MKNVVRDIGIILTYVLKRSAGIKLQTRQSKFQLSPSLHANFRLVQALFMQRCCHETEVPSSLGVPGSAGCYWPRGASSVHSHHYVSSPQFLLGIEVIRLNSDKDFPKKNKCFSLQYFLNIWIHFFVIHYFRNVWRNLN